MMDLQLAAAHNDDFEALIALRIAAMRESLERIGRFDPARARERFRSGFDPDCTRHILLDGARVGFLVTRQQPDTLLLDHLYLHPDFQGRGIGGWAMQRVIGEAAALGLPIRVGALRGSDSNRFYQRHGFVQVAEDAWDIYYLRRAGE